MQQTGTPGSSSPTPSRGARAERPRRSSTACTVAGAACLWAWGYVANLSSALFPSKDVVDSISIEFAYYASQLTMLALGILIAVAMERWRPNLSPATVVGAAGLLALSSLAIALMLSAAEPPVAAIVGCGVLYGVGGMVLTVAWGARFSLGSRDMRRPVLLSFLLGYVLYLVSLCLPTACAHLLAYVLPLASGGLWLVDSWRRHRLTMEVWPSRTPSGPLLGEAAEGSADIGVLPWRTMALFAATALVGNLATALLMGSTYNGAAVMFPGGFLVCGCITCAAIVLVPKERRRVGVERLYRYCLPFAVLGMLLIIAVPAGERALAGAMVNGASIFLQALVMLKVTEATQLTGASPLLSFGVGQGLIGGVVFAGNVLGRALSGTAAHEAWLTLACAGGVFVLFFLLVMMAETLSDRLAALEEDAAQTQAQARPRARTAASGEGGAGRGCEGGHGRGARPGGADGKPGSTDGDLAGSDGGPDVPGALDAFASRHDLTRREAEVCAYLLRGRSLPFIAEQLYVTAGTVKTHAAHIYRKAGVGGKQELIDLYERETR